MKKHVEQKKLRDVAEVISGYTFRKGLKKESDGDVLVLQARNIVEGDIIHEDDLLRSYLGNNRTNAGVKTNDVVLSSRGIFKSSVMGLIFGNVVAASSVYLLRLKTEKVLPRYLSIFLNSEFAQRQMYDKVTGVVVNALLRKDVEGIEVNIPSLVVQQKIIEIFDNNVRHQKLLMQKQFRIDQINHGLINKLINS